MNQNQANDAIAMLAEELRNRLEIGPMRHVKIQKFTPTQDIRIWLTAFDQRCEVEGIDEEHRKQELLANLDLSTAFAAVQRLNLPEDLEYEEFKERLIERFGRIGSSAEFREEFRGRMQGRNEPVETFADCLIELASRAFPNMTVEQREEEIVEQFIKGIRIPSETREKLIFAQPGNLQEARRMLRRMEAAWNMSHKNVNMRMAKGEGESEQKADQEKLEDIIKKQRAELEQQKKAIEELMEEKRASRQQYHPQNQYQTSLDRQQQQQQQQPPQQQQQPRACYNCGKLGHMARNCQSARPNGQRVMNYQKQQGN
uniref:CCHC-type domain-containing protein n=1 Tax=Macrostomum lignano TaxID=282301 RepID=A0A1I8IYI7_9PLAT